mgnify:CR=1 FL=1
MLTHYFLEIYDVTFARDAIMGPLIVARPDSGALWLTEDQIASQDAVTMHIDGAERAVRVNARLLIKAAESPTDVVVYPPQADSALAPDAGDEPSA